MIRLRPMLLMLVWMLPTAGYAQGLWEKMYPDPNTTSRIGWSYSYRVATEWDPLKGGLIAYVTDTNSTYHVHTHYVRLDAKGDTLWTRQSIFGKDRHSGSEDVRSVCRLSNGDFIIAALCDSLGGRYFHIVRIDSIGNVLYRQADLNPASAHVNIWAAPGPGGGYFIVRNKRVSRGTAQTTFISQTTWLERYDAANTRMGIDSVVRETMSRNTVPPCSWNINSYRGLRPLDFYLMKTRAVTPAPDNGLFCVFQQDSSLAFDPSICGLAATGARAGSFVHKYDSAMRLQWRTHLSDALNIPHAKMVETFRAWPTADSGLLILGNISDTTTLNGRAPFYWAPSGFLIKLNKAGIITDTLRAPPSVLFTNAIETSQRRFLVETITYRSTPTWHSEQGLCLLDEHFNLIRFTPQPAYGSPFHWFESMTANQYGGAFATYYVDTADWQWGGAIPASINFDSLLHFLPATASGKILLDTNRNCTFEAAVDRPEANRIVQIRNVANNATYYARTDANGDWLRSLPYGVYDITHTPAKNKAAECPVAGFPAVGLSTPTIVGGLDFYDTLKAGYKDVSVQLSSLRFVPGFTRKLFVYASNNGGASRSDTLRVTKPGILSFVSATPAPASVSGNSLIWVLNNIAPDSIVTITVNLTTPASTTIGTGLAFSAAIIDSVDAFQTDNSDSLTTEVVGPYDPNCKTVNRPTYTTATDDWVYTIEFQNTGNYPAQDVVITDKLDSLLDITSIRLLAASHNLPALQWQEGNELLFRFDNINLPDSVHNEPASHGFVSFSIRPVPAIKTGDRITNSAAIYFDFNPPIQTNSTLNIITAPYTSVTGMARPQQLSAYPNPTTGSLTIHSGAAGAGTLFDMHGRYVQRFPIPQGTSAVQLPEGLPAGVYLLQGRSTDGASLGVLRIIVK